jgi:hypothetical protein
LPVVSHEGEISHFALREYQKLRMFYIMVLKVIPVAKRMEIT